MRIRSITCFCNPLDDVFIASIKQLAELAKTCREDFAEKGWETQTLRLATIPFGIYTTTKNAVSKIRELETRAVELGFNYLSVGPARIHYPSEFRLIPEILSETSQVFASAFLSHPHQGISTRAVRECAKVIVEAAKISPDGFANLNFCAISNVTPFTPFFPAAYSYGSQPAFAIAVESADAALAAFQGVKQISEGRNKMLSVMNEAADEMGKIAKLNARQQGISFKGFDFSLAPFPEDWCSIGKALENLGVPFLGGMGSLTAAAILAEALDRGKWLKAGFNGLMLPVLEDSVLAERSENCNFTIKDLLMYSAVCGTGLDTVPLPGDIRAEQIEPLLMDIAALSLRLKKPLTARLMPVPGLEGGDQTQFDFEFFKNGRIMDFPAAKLAGLLAKSGWIQIHSR